MLKSVLSSIFRGRKEKQALRQEQERYRAEFVANVSHELKTPLTAIRNYVDTLMEGAIDDKKHNRTFLYKIDKHVNNLSLLIDDILEVSRLESKQELGPLVRFDISKTLKRAVETISEKANDKRIAIKLYCSGEQYYINGLEDQVYRAILNLLDNAINYSDEDGSVEISCKQKDNNVEIAIADNGIGIAEKHLPRIFERFYRVDRGRSRELGGTGLGLAIVKHVMNLHQGLVSVKSEIGEGSSFTLRFPL
ncbi:MAG: ATP-binding protein [Candidatus Margulisiibacteriota bacterium]